MNFTINEQPNHSVTTLIIGIPDHVNQINDITYNNQNIVSQLKVLKQHHIIGSELGKIYSTAFDFNGETKRLITVGLGNLKYLNYSSLFKVWGNLFQYLKQEHVAEAELLLDSMISKYNDPSLICKVCGLQSESATYQFDNYKSDKSAPFQTQLYLFSEEYKEPLASIQQGQIIGQAINYSRDFSNMPPNILTPQHFASEVEQHFVDTAVQVEVKNDEQILAEGFGLLYAVGQGGQHKPRLITLNYNGGKENEAPIALVGKGVTYDSGGYSIKSKTGMQTMKFDMCGAADVIALVSAVNQLQLPINIVAVIPAAENMISDRAMKPDDVFTALSGETVEVLNSDAEGRLILGDAVAYASQFKPQLILDFATLTGAAIVALGEDKGAAFQSNAEAPLSDILTVAHQVDELVFELPITRTEQQLIRQSSVADLVNHTNGQGKALFAAAFITHFSGTIPHIHFDIAGPATTTKANYKGPKGPTGFMITTILEWLMTKNLGHN